MHHRLLREHLGASSDDREVRQKIKKVMLMKVLKKQQVRGSSRMEACSRRVVLSYRPKAHRPQNLSVSGY